MTIDEIITHIMTNPENTNPAVLRDMLNNLSNNGNSESSDSPYNYLMIPLTYEVDYTLYEENENQSPGG